MSSFKAMRKPLSYYPIHHWSDIEICKGENGEWVIKPGGYDPMRDYIAALDTILITGQVANFDVLRALRKELDETRRVFIGLQFEGIYEGKKGGKR